MSLPPIIEPIVYILAGILILVQPRFLHLIVAIALIVIGALGLLKFIH